MLPDRLGAYGDARMKSASIASRSKRLRTLDFFIVRMSGERRSKVVPGALLVTRLTRSLESLMGLDGGAGAMRMLRGRGIRGRGF
jgi:hypothetical protein